ncbi:MAG: prephenate dehydrogenase/arogenate dehydrogenase family protein [Clostridia bacterium]|nr:prephenate dehydrogenase/arogenate dehydrogenase family protein [Clostridia bacterium]
MNEPRIGYQGIPGSNSEYAAVRFAGQLGLDSYELIPLVTSKGVVDALRNGVVRYGVMASQNIVAGSVEESRLALENLSYKVLSSMWVSVHHCLFVKDASVAELSGIASHIQAFLQCKNTLQELYPGKELREMEDTSIAAQYLAEGNLPPDFGVLCRKNAGEMFGLHLLKENLEDDSKNMTQFILIEQQKQIPKTVVVAGLGLIGGSMAKALKKHTGYKVYGWNRTQSVAETALADGAIDGIADDAIIASCDILIPVLYPESTLSFLKKHIPSMKEGAMVVDLVGVKTRICNEIEPVAVEHGIRFTGGHPMAGLSKAGYSRSFADLFRGTSMILVPTDATADGDLEYLTDLFLSLGFGRIKVCDRKTHDRMIAHTSQLAHVVSNSYVKSPVSQDYVGYAGGSYKDMTRIACLNEKVWRELFIWNKDALLPEIENLLHEINKIYDAIKSEDYDGLETILRAGREAKELIDMANPSMPSD